MTFYFIMSHLLLWRLFKWMKFSRKHYTLEIFVKWKDLHRLTAVGGFNPKIFVSVFDFKTLYQANTNCYCQTHRHCCCCFRFHMQHFSIFLPTLTLADNVFLGSGLSGWAKEGTGGGKEVLVFAAWRWSGPDGCLSPPDALYLSISATGTQ